MVKKHEPKEHQVKRFNGMTSEQALAHAAIHSGANAAYVIDAFQGNLLGGEVHFSSLIEALDKSIDKTSGGDLAKLEAMLVGQATALQTIFASLARRAAGQQSLKHYEAFLGLAFKAQAQSRATIQAVVDLKYPRQAVFAKQANISHGPQQVNNGSVPTYATSTHPCARAREELENPQIKQLEEASHESFRMDPREAREAVSVDPDVAALGQVNRSAH